MNKVLAVALLDWRRLALGLVSAALVAGLIPSLSSGLGARVEVAPAVAVVLMVVGAAAGATFGSDFFSGKSSFYFARPLPIGVLFAGRFAALLALEGATFLSFMAASWISTSDRSTWTLAVLTRSHVEGLLTAWTASLFVSLSVAAHPRGARPESGMRAVLMIALRLGVSLGAFLLVFGLFADLVLRAYFNDFTPVQAVAYSWVVAALVASGVAIAAGRTERLRIAHFQGRVMAAHFLLVSIAVVAAWLFVLHPSVDDIRRVDYTTWGSPDGRTAYLHAIVDRGGRAFRPVFALDIASGHARQLNADPDGGPWLSSDGAIVVWSEATPFFFRPLWRRLGGSTTFRVRSASGDIAPLPMPRALPDYTSVRDFSNFGGAVDWVLPAPDGDVFAIQWGRRLSFTSRSRGELSEIDDSKNRGLSRGIALADALFLPSGALRATRIVRGASGMQSVTVIDIDPKTGSITPVGSIPIDGPVWAQLDARAERVLLVSSTQPGRGAFVSLLGLSGDQAGARPTVLVEDALFPAAIFLADGRIAVSTGGTIGAWQKRTLRIFSATGQMELDIPLGDGTAPRLAREMFPGILAANTEMFKDELSLIDTTSGAVVRRIPGMHSPGWFLRNRTSPGSPTARLLGSRDGKLYELPSVNAEPRLLLPLPR